MIPAERLEELKATVSVAEVLNRLGHDPGRAGRTRCPIHGGDNPQSFSYRDGVFYCFACGAGGDVLDLTRKLRGCDFKAAVTWLGGDTTAGTKQSAVLSEAVLARRRERAWRVRSRSEGWRLMHALYEAGQDVEAEVEWLRALGCLRRHGRALPELEGASWDRFWTAAERLYSLEREASEWDAAQQQRAWRERLRKRDGGRLKRDAA